METRTRTPATHSAHACRFTGGWVMGVEVLRRRVERVNGVLLASDDDSQIDLLVTRYRPPAIRGIVVGTRHPAVYRVADVTRHLREGETGIKYGNKLALGRAKNERVQPDGLPIRSEDAVDGAGPVLITLERAREGFDWDFGLVCDVFEVGDELADGELPLERLAGVAGTVEEEGDEVGRGGVLAEDAVEEGVS